MLQAVFSVSLWHTRLKSFHWCELPVWQKSFLYKYIADNYVARKWLKMLSHIAWSSALVSDGAHGLGIIFWSSYHVWYSYHFLVLYHVWSSYHFLVVYHVLVFVPLSGCVPCMVFAPCPCLRTTFWLCTMSWSWYHFLFSYCFLVLIPCSNLCIPEFIWEFYEWDCGW
jgi:hypothetical protein